MTIAIAWIAKRTDGKEHLYFASDSRTRGGRVFDHSPKIITLPRSDAALCFSGRAEIAYPMMQHIAMAIAAHEPARDRNLDIRELLKHLLRVLTDTASRIREDMDPFDKHDPEFVFGGYSWIRQDYCLWTISYDPKSKEFTARESMSFDSKLRKIAMTGDQAKRYRSLLNQSLSRLLHKPHVHMEPLRVMSEMLEAAGPSDSIGGPPQVLRIGAHMNTRPLSTIWRRKRYLFGRELLSYERCDYWSIDPFSGRTFPPSHFNLSRKEGSIKSTYAARLMMSRRSHRK